MSGPALLLSLTLAAPLAGDGSTSWPVFRGDPALTGVAAGTVPAAPALRWTFQAAKGIVSSPVVEREAPGGPVLVVGCDDGLVYALDATTGTKRWTFPTGDVIEAPPLIANGSVFIGSSDGRFHALDLATGALRWTRETGDKILGGANALTVAGEERVVVGSYDSNLYCFAAADGAERWRYSTGNFVNGTPAVLGERIVFGGCDAVLHVVSASDGSALAQIELGNDAHVAGSVALAGERVYLGHYGNAFVCVDLGTKQTRWSLTDPKQPFFSSPALAHGKVYFGGRNKKLHCCDAESGELLWSFPTRRKVDGSPIAVGDAIVFGAADGRLYVLDASSGEERWSHDLGADLGGSLAVADGWIYAAALDGRVVGFGPPASQGSASVPREGTR
jgi:outer membrane protein assembly factor BamB